MQAWHDEQRVERGRYAGLLAAGVTDAATLEPPAPVPARRVEVARATQVALPVWLAAPGAAARPVVGALPVLPTAMRAADVRAAGVLVNKPTVPKNYLFSVQFSMAERAQRLRREERRGRRRGGAPRRPRSFLAGAH